MNTSNGINPLDVEIKTISLKGKRLTKSIFNQIETVNCFKTNMDFGGDEIFGYVNDRNNRYLIWALKGNLRKTNLSPFYRLKRSSNSPVIEEMEWFLNEFGLGYSEHSGFIRNFAERIGDIKRYDELVLKSANFFGKHC